MRHWKIGILLLLAGCAPGPRTVVPGYALADSAAAGRGAVLARSKCSSCHATGLTGRSPHPSAPPFRELDHLYPLQNLQEAFAEGFVTAHPDMPEFAFEPDQIVDLIAYLESVSHSPVVAR